MSTADAFDEQAFDEHNPPSLDLLNECVHCGFCLAACPTYTLWGEEMDSPRGRIDLMRQGVTGEPLTASMVTAFDQCLGCMACVPACPSGVRYDILIEQARGQVERRRPRSFYQRLLRASIFAVFPYPQRLRVAAAFLRLYRGLGIRLLLRKLGLRDRLPPTVRMLESIAPDTRAAEQLPARIPAVGTRRATVGLLTGCVQSVFFSHVNAATARVLAAEGCDVVVPPAQGCCGALSAHNGREAEAARFARTIVDTFAAAGVEKVVVNSAGCGSTMKDYERLLRDDPHYAEKAAVFSAQTRDIAEFLHELGPVAPRHPLQVNVAYHDACHLANAQGIRSQPRELLAGIPALQVREIAEATMCCGSAGIYNLLQPETAAELGDRKASGVAATGAELLVTANPGCLMQISASLQRAGKTMPAAHTIEVLDASIRGLPVASLTGSR
jgi:glycolate oxidase iron-sulfur subunit